MKRVIVLGLVLLLAACGKTAPLRPAPGATLPPKSEAAKSAPDAEKLMTPSDQARPRRNDELLQDSQVRQPDRFDLPPQ